MRNVALVALVLLAAPALADHVYSHRFIFEGRLVGSDGTPLPGREVEFFSVGEDFLEPCREGPHQSVTDEWGDFRFCFHHHQFAEGARAGVRVGNASVERPVDVALRRTVVTLREPNETGVAPPGWESTFRVSGRAWEVGPTTLEGIQVYGVAAIGLPVNLTVRGADGSTRTFPTMTDGFGDFDLVIEAPDPENVTLLVEALGRPQPVALDSFSHRAYAPIYLPGQHAGSLAKEETMALPGEGSQAPGTTTPRVNPVLVVALALGLVAAILLSRRKK
ncbi:MAG TPA: hypothetical protein VFH78_13710 [Candidatus Thermoplasmatota archaeon]|nr:hypothetical protein [Candidatus Thermoplasmatota archaeon]